MKKFLIILTVILTSLFFFPFEFKALPGVNTKMMLAVLGLVLLLFKMVGNRSFKVRTDLFKLIVLAAVVSLIAYFSITVNNTSDTAYATYIVSMAVWLSAAYAVVCIIKAVHGTIDVPLVCRYLIAVCVAQCILAMVIEYNPGFKHLVDSIIEQNQDFLNHRNVHRLYGIGASLDVAGARFSTVLIAIMYLLFQENTEEHKLYDTLYIIAYGVIAVIGNIIARTTTVGLLLSLGYMLFMIFRKNTTDEFKKKGRVTVEILLIFAVLIPIIISLFNHNASFQKQIMFGFEGFFSLAETGNWQTSSNDKLMSMIVFPETLKTWVIGDGYFSSPENDKNFIGEIVDGYYMGTDIGYLRFIFYFGLLGLAAFSVYMLEAALICARRFTKEKIFFLLVLLAGFIIWLKVSTDIFLFFALFVAMEAGDSGEEKDLIDSV